MSQLDLFDIGAQLRRQFAECRRERGYREDCAQQSAFEHLAQWAAWHLAGRGNSLLRQPARGVYVWGGAGRGKRFVMDCFYDAVPLEARCRMNAQAFFDALQRGQGARPDAAGISAVKLPDELAHTRLLCLDDVQLHTCDDTVLLSLALETALDAGTLVVMTSRDAPRLPGNAAPAKTSQEPVARLFHECFDVVHVGGHQNYRL